jgi:hypothetical protein
VNRFAEWLAQTSLSLAIQTHEWVIPTLQSAHIVAIGVVVSTVLMIDLRVLGWAGRDQTLTETNARFTPWLFCALAALFLTGAAMVVGEPARELLALSFWMKMGLVAVGTVTALVFQRSVARQQERWETVLVHRRHIKALAVVTLLIWICIVILGRLIAYDYVWGSWSASLKG